MEQIQAVILICPDLASEKALSDFTENGLNLYAAKVQTIEGGIKTIFDGGSGRDQVFSEMENLFKDNDVPRIILIGHENCPSRAEGSEADERQLEVELRHAVSGVHAKFSDQEVDAYIYIAPEFKKVV